MMAVGDKISPPKIYNAVSLSSKYDERDISKLVYKLAEALQDAITPGMSQDEQLEIIKQFAREGVLQASTVGDNSVKLFTEVMDNMGKLSKDAIAQGVFDSDSLSAFKYIDNFKLKDYYSFDDVLNKANTLINDNARASYRETVQIAGESVELEEGDHVRQRHKAAPDACDFCCRLEMWNSDSVLPHPDCKCGVEQYIANAEGQPVYLTDVSERMEKFYKKLDEPDEDFED